MNVSKSIVSDSLVQNVLASLNHAAPENTPAIQVTDQQKQEIINSLHEWRDFVLSESKAPRIYQSLQEMQSDISRTGLSKNTEAKDWNGKVLYKTRGIDDVYNLLSPLFAKHNITLGLKTLSRECELTRSKSGTVQYQTIITNEYEFISTLDGSKHTVTVIGEALDTSDKGTAKAMAMAFKVACFQIFCIPVCEDADSIVSEPIASHKKRNSNQQQYNQNGGNNYQNGGNHSGNADQSKTAINTKNDNSIKITKDQAKLLTETIRKAGQDPKIVLTHYKIQRLGELSLHRFNAIMTRMQTYIAESVRIQQQQQQFDRGYHDQRNYS